MSRESKTAEAIKLLEERGVRVNLGGCGCCGSPWVSIEIDGKLLLDDEDACCIYMIEDEEDK